MPAVLIYITVADEEEALRLGRLLVEENLVACANVVPRLLSCFRWEGQVQQEEESLLLAKTRSHLVSAIVDRVKAAHSYEVPAVLALEISDGNPDFLQWIGQEVGTGR